MTSHMTKVQNTPPCVSLSYEPPAYSPHPKRAGRIRAAGLYKAERIIDSHQGVEIRLADGRTVLNFCANNYLGLASHPRVIQAAHEALDRWGYGMASVRFHAARSPSIKP